jgi:hypothetical protein
MKYELVDITGQHWVCEMDSSSILRDYIFDGLLINVKTKVSQSEDSATWKLVGDKVVSYRELK